MLLLLFSFVYYLYIYIFFFVLIFFLNFFVFTVTSALTTSLNKQISIFNWLTTKSAIVADLLNKNKNKKRHIFHQRKKGYIPAPCQDLKFKKKIQKNQSFAICATSSRLYVPLCFNFFLLLISLHPTDFTPSLPNWFTFILKYANLCVFAVALHDLSLWYLYNTSL